jgi:predicted ATPase
MRTARADEDVRALGRGLRRLAVFKRTRPGGDRPSAFPRIRLQRSGSTRRSISSRRSFHRSSKLAANGPVGVALEDLHWRDPSSVVALRAFQRRLSRLPIGLLATMRTSPRNHELEAFLQMAIDFGAHLVSISPLREVDVSRLAGQLLGVPPGPKLNELLNGAAGNSLLSPSY